MSSSGQNSGQGGGGGGGNGNVSRGGEVSIIEDFPSSGFMEEVSLLFPPAGDSTLELLGREVEEEEEAKSGVLELAAVTILEAVETNNWDGNRKPKRLNLCLLGDEGMDLEDIPVCTLRLSPQGIFEFRMAPLGKQFDRRAAVLQTLFYSTPIAYAVYGNVFEILFWSNGAFKGVRFSVDKEEDISRMEKYLEGLTAEVDVKREVEKMKTRGWFMPNSGLSGLLAVHEHVSQQNNYYFKREGGGRGGGGGDEASNKKWIEQMAGCVQESGLNLSVTVLSLLDTNNFVCNLPPDALSNIHLQLSHKDGIWRFFTRAVGAEGRELPAMTLEYASPIAISSHDGMIEVLFRNLKAVRFQLRESAEISAWVRGATMTRLFPQGSMSGLVWTMKEKMGWFNGEYYYLYDSEAQRSDFERERHRRMYDDEEGRYSDY